VPAAPASAETRHAPLHVKEESLPLLLAVVADVDADLGLAPHGFSHRLAPGGFERGIVDLLAARAPSVELEQAPRPRQAARVGGKNARGALQHRIDHTITA